MIFLLQRIIKISSFCYVILANLFFDENEISLNCKKKRKKLILVLIFIICYVTQFNFLLFILDICVVIFNIQYLTKISKNKSRTENQSDLSPDLVITRFLLFLMHSEQKCLKLVCCILTSRQFKLYAIN